MIYYKSSSVILKEKTNQGREGRDKGGREGIGEVRREGIREGGRDKGGKEGLCMDGSWRYESNLPRNRGVYKVSYNLIFFPTPNFLNLIFNPKLPSPSSLLRLIFFPIGKMILHPLYLFPYYILPHIP